MYILIAINKNSLEVDAIAKTSSNNKAKRLLWDTVKLEQGYSDRHKQAIQEQEYADSQDYRYEILEVQ
jgi:hypothetical protein